MDKNKKVERKLIIKLGGEKFISNYPKITLEDNSKNMKSRKEKDVRTKEPRKKKYLTNRDLSDEIKKLREDHIKMFEILKDETAKIVGNICKETVTKYQKEVEPKQHIYDPYYGEYIEKFYVPKRAFYEHSEKQKYQDSTKPIQISEANNNDISINMVNIYDASSSTLKRPFEEDETKSITKRESSSQSCSSKNIIVKTETMEKTLKRIKTEEGQNSSDGSKHLPTHSEPTKIPGIAVLDDSKIQIQDMSVINKWMADQKKNHAFKSKKALDAMLTPNGLYPLFKCMSLKCPYTTTSDNNFLTHLNIHMESNFNYKKDYHLNCPYCFFVSSGPIDLINHYRKLHNKCIYQCNLCFYRSAEAQSVYDHQINSHKDNLSKRQILQCQQLFSVNEKEEEEKGMLKVKNLKKNIHCFVCAKNFIVPEDFLNHLTNDHKKPEEESFVKHQKEKIKQGFDNRKIGKYQCIECDIHQPFGSNNRIEIRTHLHTHPRKLHYVCVRESNICRLQRILPRKDIVTKVYDGNLEELKNDEGVSNILF